MDMHDYLQMNIIPYEVKIFLGLPTNEKSRYQVLFQFEMSAKENTTRHPH